MDAFASVTELSIALADKKISSRELTDLYLDRITKIDPSLNSHLTVAADSARVAADAIDARRATGEKLHALAGIPFGVKDAITTAGVRATGAAKILDNYIPTHDATVIARLRAAGGVMIGKHNCDTFGHGASNENSMYGPANNPWDVSRVAGGSSGGSGAAVAAGLQPYAIGEDTGGSVRAPAAFCGVSGLKVSYGRNSRFGAMPMASSLDTVGVFGQTVADIALVMQTIAGHDPLDPTSAVAPVPNYTHALEKTVQGLRIGVPAEFFSDDLDPAIRASVESALEVFQNAGAQLIPVTLPHIQYAIATYYILVPCEDSSNMARYDGIRYGVRASRPDLFETYAASRTEGLPNEVKRRIMIGTFALSHGYYEAYYLRAQKARTLICQDFANAFEKVDVMISPTMPEIAFKKGEKTTDPLKMYLADVFTGSASLAGLSALSVPCGFSQNMPIGMQIIAPRLAEDIALHAGHIYQKNSDWHTRHPAV